MGIENDDILDYDINKVQEYKIEKSFSSFNFKDL